MSTERATEVIQRSLLVEVNGGELEPIWQIYKPEGVALVIRQALAAAGLLVTAEAADEIERLRAALKRCHVAMGLVKE